jgi:hypothetical protein
MEAPHGPGHGWCHGPRPQTAAMRRRPAALLATVLLLALAGCQSARPAGDGATRFSEPTMATPSPVNQARHPSDSPRYHQFDP